MADGNPDVVVQNTAGGTAADINVTAEEQERLNASKTDGPTAQSLGVSDEQFRKYWSAEKGAYNWEAHAKEAEYRASQDGTTADAPAADAAESEAAAKSAAEKAGLDFDALGEQIVNSGDIGEAEYRALEDIGIPADVVSDYIDAVKERAENHKNTVIAAFGGEEAFEQVKAYAAKNYTEAEMDEFDQKLSNKETYKSAVDTLRAAAGILPGTRGTPVNAPNDSAGGERKVTGFNNDMELQGAIRDPRYRTDPNYRAEVLAKVAASTYTNNPRAHAGGL